MWWINLVRKVQWKWKSSWRLQKMCRELRLMIQLGGKKMRRAIRGAQAGLRRFARFQMWLIRKKDLKRRGLFVPADLSSMEEVETDELVEEYGDDLYVITMGTLPKHKQCPGAHHGKKLEDSSSKSIYNLPGYMSHNSPLRYRSTRQTSAHIDIDKSGPSSCQNNYHTLPKTKAEKSRRHGRRSRFNDNDSYSEFMEEETSQRSAFLDFLFEDSPSPSRFLTAQALQNILGCPTCREIVSILPSDISPSRGCRPCEQCQGYLQTGKCLLCECSYGETKSLLLEKLTMSSWLRSCRYQSYGCQSLVGIGVDVEHNEDDCKFKPLHCPFMLCRRKFPAASLIKHLQSEHRLQPHDDLPLG
ncbi:unnamed protein product [Allacma fusca]|uniref:SIAH-type domain-containing protein n=1 Tax=Allacma fusca TaxID=39272 RepID=A0A8J2KQH2_9HEXA|nr:unnamed protein product [Allacma fusca]